MARDRGIAELLAAIEADRWVRELARNPMLATLIALVHRYEAHLPGERAKLYELCVKTLLETWPAARKQTFHEIDVGLQRAYLEALAWRMQTARKSRQRDVTIERKTLLEVLQEIARERGDSGIKPAMLESWVRYLETGTGLLVEQRPGVFGFFHLSLMEYLAACALDAASEPDEKIARRYGDAGWREVCLLAVGKRATDKAFLDRLWERFERHKEEERWSFLLSCLREEAAFDDRQRETIVARAARALLDQMPSRWKLDYLALDEIMRLSLRHGEWARGWVDRQIRTARGREFRAVVSIRIFAGEDRLRAVLMERPDVADVFAELRHFGLSAIDGWTEGRLDPANGAEAGQP
ncbi:MAG: hypothetical protein HC897_06335 [Thermoanaerobaculia bacterium]|nr:hypothetical protein [Thermoanaerobaculia bacterium]